MTAELQNTIMQIFEDFERLGLTPDQSLVVANYRLLFHQLLNICDQLYHNSDAFRRQCRYISVQNAPASFAELAMISSRIIEALKKAGSTIGAIESLEPVISMVNEQIQQQQKRTEHLN